MTRLSRVKMDWTPADAKTHIIVHFLTNKFLSENHQLLVKMNMHQWYILHKYTCVGSGLALDMEEIFHTHNLSNVGPLSVKPCREAGPKGHQKSDNVINVSGQQHLLESSVTGKLVPDFHGVPLTMEDAGCLTRQSDKGGEYWLTSCTAHFTSEHVQHNFRITHSQCSPNLDDPQLTGASNSDFYPDWVLGSQLPSVLIKEDVEEWALVLSRPGGQEAAGAKLRRVQSGPGQTRGPGGDHSYVSNGRWAKRSYSQEQDYQMELTKIRAIQEYHCKRYSDCWVRNDKHFDQQRNIYSDN